MQAFPFWEAYLFVEVALSDPVNANLITRHQQSFSTVYTLLLGMLSLS